MKVKIDFQLNRQFGVVERIIFRFVLRGFTDTREIANALPLFSDFVIANAIKSLVNRQILSVKSETGHLALSEPIVAIIDKCFESEYEICIPSELKGEMLESGLLISGNTSEDTMEMKKAILYELLPGVRLDMYMDSLDFALYIEKRGGQDG